MFDIKLYQKRRKELKLTYDDLAKLSGVSRRTIAGMFGEDKAYQSPNITTIAAIEKALGLSEDGSKYSVPKGYDLTEKEKRLLDAFRLLIPSLQDYLIETAEKLVEASSNGSKIEKRKA